MGEVIPGECVTNVLHENNHLRIMSSSDYSWERLVWERMQQQPLVDHVLVASAAVVEPMRRDEEEEDKGEGIEEGMAKGSSSTEDFAPKQMPALQATVLAAPKLWAVGPSVCVA